MVDLAQQAFSTKNYDLAAEIYDRTIREHGPSGSLYLGLADSYARSGRLETAFRAYSNAFRCGPVSPDQLTNLVTALVDKMGENEDLKTDSKLSPEDQMFACDICKGMWNDPVTVSCGHTFCRKCLEKSSSKTCVKCGTVHSSTRISHLKTNVLLTSLIDKWFSHEAKAVKLKAEGNSLFANRRYHEAIDVYSKAFSLAPTDHLIPSNRSFAYASLERYEEALRDAEITIKLRPDWAKGYYRKATALSGLCFHEEAAMAYLQCLTLDSSVTSARTALAKTLHKVLSGRPVEDVKLAELQSVFSVNRPFGAFGGADLSSLVSGGIDENLLQQIKTRLRETLIQSGMVPSTSTGTEQQQQQQQQQQATACCGTKPGVPERLLAERGVRCHSAPSSRPPSPALCDQRSASNLNLAEMETRLTRKRSSDDVRREELVSSHSVEMTSQGCCRKKATMTSPKAKKRVDDGLRQKDDFECSLCYRLLYNPVTTPCGHTYCRQCLDRSLDHNSSCPLCKSSLVEYLAERRQVTTEGIEVIIQTYFPEDFEERKKIYEEELSDLARMDTDQVEVPIFVCTLAYPYVPCPLHVFEPRYRLMIRQCMESGTRQFGMCLALSNNDNEFAEVGTMLEVRNVQYFPDGRSVVDTVGGRRFKVISKGHRDGYNTACVEYLKDKEVAEGTELEELSQLHTEVHQEARDWYTSLPTGPAQRIRQHFGEFPELEPDHLRLDQGPLWLWWLTAVLPLQPKAQLTILAMNGLKDRLTSVRRVLGYMKRQQSAP